MIRTAFSSCMLAFILFVAACTAIDIPEFDDSCTATSQCIFGKICDTRANQCVWEPDNGFLGGFSCTIGASPSEAPWSVTSEVIGTVDGYRVPLHGGERCWKDTSTTPPQLVVKLKTRPMFVGYFAPSDVYDLELFVPWPTASRATSMDILPRTAVNHFFAMVCNDDSPLCYAYSAGGTLELSAPAQVDATVSGFVDIAIYPAIDADTVFGVLCPRGMADCGMLSNSANCFPLSYPDSGTDKHPVCSLECTQDSDCAAVDASVCITHLCTKTCRQNSYDCAELRCILDPVTQKRGCL
jgi:hypothetical protein